MSTDDKTICWNTPECAGAMVEALEALKKSGKFPPHLTTLKELIDSVNEKGESLLDLACGTAFSSEYCTDYKYSGADFPHILSGAAMKLYPQHPYHNCNIEADDINWIKRYRIILANGFFDAMERPLEMLDKVLKCASEYLILHRQEISETKATHVFRNGSYNAETFHSIMSRKDFERVIGDNHFYIAKELNCGFDNWENGGHSFVLRKKKSYALHEIDFKLVKLFDYKRNGFYIEAGANDGITQSNTYGLESYHGWKGLLIEPVFTVCQKCVDNRSTDINYIFNCALVSPEYKESTIEMIYTPKCAGMLSVINDSNAPKLMKRTDEKGEMVQVPARTLNDVLKSLKPTPDKIDLLVLDVEGYEANALQGLDLNKWIIDYILVEELGDKSDTIRNILSPLYDQVDLYGEHDYLYHRK